MTEGAAIKNTVEVKLDELVADVDVQRSLDANRVERMAANFMPDAFGALTICLRPDGSRAIIDGQHRHAAGILAGYDKAVTAIQYEGLTKGEEAVLFLTLNDSKQLQPIDKFRARVLSGEPQALAVKEVLDEHGWVVRISAEDWSLTAINAVEKIYGGMGVVKGGDTALLHNVMTLISASWNGLASSVHGTILGSMGKFLGWYGTQVDYEKMITELQVIKPRNLIGDIRVLREMQRVDIPNAGARVLVNIHNQKRRANRLPEWVNR